MERFLRKQSGNFLLQALLALTLMFAFLPFLAGKLSSRDMTSKLLSVKETIDTLQTAARIYLREQKNNLYIGSQTFTGPVLTKKLEPYGLPMGFSKKTIFNQEFSFQYNKASSDEINAHIILSPGNITKMQAAELVRMIGPMAVKGDDQSIHIAVPVTAFEYSNVVYRDMAKYNDVPFSTTLNMNGNNIIRIGTIDNTKKYGEECDTCYVSTNSANFSHPTGGSLNIKDVSALLTSPLSSSFNLTLAPKAGKTSATFLNGLVIDGNVTIVTIDNLSNVKEFKDIATLSAPEADINNLTASNATVVAKNWDITGTTYIPGINFGSNTEDGRIPWLKLDGAKIASGGNVVVDRLIPGTVYTCDNDFSSTVGCNKVLVKNTDPSKTLEFEDMKIGSLSQIAVIVKPYMAGELTVENGGLEDCNKALKTIFGNDYTYDSQSVKDNILCQYLILERWEMRLLYLYCWNKGICRH